MHSSGDTLLRDIHQAPEPDVDTPRVLGIDDWANCRGKTYGTILVDLEKQRPIDLLDTRETEAVEAWLKAHPGVEIISRDRGKEYVKAASSGAPNGEQVADRWHLLKNLREALQSILTNKPACLKAAALEPSPDEVKQAEQDNPPPLSEATRADPSPSLSDNVPSSAKPTKAQQYKTAVHARRQERYDQVRQLHRDDYSIRGIARLMKMSTRTVRKYIEADTCPQYPAGRVHRSKLNPHLPYLEARWQSGCTNASQLWRELRDEHGFIGSRGLVARWAAKQRKLLPAPARYRRQQGKSTRPQLARQHKPAPWSASRASWLLFRDRSQLDEQEAATVKRIIAADSKVAEAVELVQRFVEIVKKRQKDCLATWLEDARAVHIRALTSFVNGIAADFAAVYNALRMDWSNGQPGG